MAVYHYHALAIQGAFRGYQSRKYNYNHARRKGYLQEVRTPVFANQQQFSSTVYGACSSCRKWHRNLSLFSCKIVFFPAYDDGLVLL